MLYDQLIGELYDIANNERISPEFEEEIRWLNFKVRKNGVKEDGDWSDPLEESDVRTVVDDIVSDLTRLADQTNESDIRQQLVEMAQDIEVNRITME